MNCVSGKLKVYYFTCPILAFITLLLRTALFLFFFDSDIGYYRADVLLTPVYYAFVILTLVWFLSLFVFIPKNTLPGKQVRMLLGGKIASLLCAAACLNIAVIKAISFFGKTRVSFFAYLIALAALLSAVYFIFNYSSDGKRSDSRILLGFAVILLSAFCLADMYFDTFTPMNSPVKVLSQFGFLAVMLFFTAEFRFELEKPKQRFYLFSMLIGIFFCSVSSITVIFSYILGILGNSKYFEYNILLLAFGALIMARTIEYIRIACAKPVTTDGENNADETAETNPSSDTETDPNTSGINPADDNTSDGNSHNDNSSDDNASA